ncbi:MAG: hypothetical protein IKE55_01165 [Kiritimatiellae bacterium]|nr:hypothetical protein [Kiritimatiellia bacterium]
MKMRILAVVVAFVTFEAFGGIDGIATGKRFLADGKVAVGVNFWGSKAATQMWSRWDEASVDEDLRVLAANGMRLLRVFPNWADFQPLAAVTLNSSNWNKVNEMRMFASEEKMPDTDAGFAGVDERMLDRFATFCDLAEKHGLRLIVPVLTGQMTFRNLIPPGLLHVDLYRDPTALKWEARFIDCFVRRMKGKKAIVAWESGNETRYLAGEPNADLAESWQRYIHSVIRLADDTRPIVGVDGLDITSDRDWPTRINAQMSDYVAVHPYHHISGKAYLDEANGIRQAFFCAAQNTLQEDVAGKPSFVEEHSYRRAPCSSRELMARYIDGMLWNLWAANARAMLWWCAFDQDHLDTAPYDWRQVYQEFGLMTSDRKNYAYADAVRDFARFQDALPFDALPPAKRDAVFIVSDSEVAHASYVLARQAGLFPRFATPEEMLPEADVYFMPCIVGRGYLGTRAWDDLRERVAAGAHLYLSWDDTFLTHLHEVTGAELQTRKGGYDPGQYDFGSFKLALPGIVHATFASVGSETLAKDASGNPVFFRFKYGKGEVHYLGFQLEKRVYSKEGGFATDAWRVYASVLPKKLLVEEDSPHVTESEHVFADGRVAVILVNNALAPFEGPVRVCGGWRVASTLTDRPNLARCEDGRLSLGTNAGILLMLERVHGATGK